MEALEQVLADEREQAAILRRNGHTQQAASIERVCERVAEAMAAYLDVLSEDNAMLRSDKRREWLRARFPEWEARGLAALRNGKRCYRAIVLPARSDAGAAHAAGLRGASLREVANG